MGLDGGHIRKMGNAQKALKKAVEFYKDICENGLKIESSSDTLTVVQAQHLAFASIGYLKAIVQFLKDGGGSRGSYLVLAADGVEVHPDVKDPDTGENVEVFAGK
ncbi:MAG: hypothetical protein FVQ82_09950 [Planctomycetes bacterium]|nr:hypothetical protein [Planctomycetota bacterium]